MSIENKCIVCLRAFCCASCRWRHEQAAHDVSFDCRLCRGDSFVCTPEYTNNEHFLVHLVKEHFPLHCHNCNRMFTNLADIDHIENCSSFTELIQEQNDTLGKVDEKFQSIYNGVCVDSPEQVDNFINNKKSLAVTPIIKKSFLVEYDLSSDEETPKPIIHTPHPKQLHKSQKYKRTSNLQGNQLALLIRHKVVDQNDNETEFVNSPTELNYNDCDETSKTTPIRSEDYLAALRDMTTPKSHINERCLKLAKIVTTSTPTHPTLGGWSFPEHSADSVISDIAGESLAQSLISANEWNGSWGLPAFVCDVYIAMDVTSSTSSIFNLVAISIDRYIAVTKPIKYAKHKNNTRVWLTIVLVWAISAAIGAPIVLGLNDTPDRNYNECLFNSQNYVIYSSLGSFYIPCIMMMFLYYNIFRALNDRLKKQRAAKRPPVPSNTGATTAVVIENVAQTRRLAETSLQDDRPTNTGSGSNEEERDDSFDRNSVDLEAGADDCHVIPNDRSTEFMLATVEEETIRRPRRSLRSPVAGDPNGNNDSGYVPSNVDEIVREASPPGSPGMKDATVLRNLGCKSSLRKNGRFGQQSSRNASVTLRHEDETSRVEIVDSPTKERKASGATSRFTIYKANKASKKKREKSSAKKERKATKTLAIVLGVFLCCWGPFFSCNMADAVHGKFRFGFSPGVTLFIVTTWLGYINSFVNPVIYTIFNPEFRKAFRKSLRCGP